MSQDKQVVDPTILAPPPRRKRWWLAVVWLVYAAVLLEVGCRIYWAYFCGVPMLDASQLLIGRFYPELRTSGALTDSITRDDEYYDVLLLAGSVFTDEYGTIEPCLRKRLGELTEKQVRVFNCAACAHTSRDSLLKYRMLEGQEFDLVVFYHAINETRLNNCPPEMFKANYSHTSWYDRIERFKRHHEIGWLVFPYTLEYLMTGVLEARVFKHYIPRHTPPDGLWYEYGTDIKTADCFRANLEELVALARERRAQVLLPTYAYYIPGDYSIERMNAHVLDYAGHKTPVEVWGRPEAVAKGIEAHNAISRDVGRANDHVILVDLDAEMPKSKQQYDDVCHLTPDGCQAWVDRVDESLRRRLKGVVASRRLPTPARTVRALNDGPTRR